MKPKQDRVARDEASKEAGQSSSTVETDPFRRRAWHLHDRLEEPNAAEICQTWGQYLSEMIRDNERISGMFSGGSIGSRIAGVAALCRRVLKSPEYSWMNSTPVVEGVRDR